jgi:outer membrane protein assembly factor BamD
MRSLQKILACGALLVVAAACASQSPLLTADPTGTVLFEQGQNALVAEDWRAAIDAFDTLLRNYPSSPFLPDSRLGIGRAYYEQGRVDSLILAIDAFQSFLTYHPSHPMVDYAQYMVGMTHVAQMRTPDRDQAATREALEAFETLIDNYPESHLRPAAVAQRQAAIDHLAEHEWQVARWQAGRDEDWDAAVDRINWALERYPETTLKCQLYFTLAEAYKKGEQAEDATRYYQRVLDDYPACEHVKQAEDRLREINGKPAAPAPSRRGA